MDGLVVHDFDEIGGPSSADVAWRQESLETWLRRVLDHQARGHLPEILTAGGWSGMAWERWSDLVRGDPRWTSQ